MDGRLLPKAVSYPKLVGLHDRVILLREFGRKLNDFAPQPKVSRSGPSTRKVLPVPRRANTSYRPSSKNVHNVCVRSEVCAASSLGAASNLATISCKCLTRFWRHLETLGAADGYLVGPSISGNLIALITFPCSSSPASSPNSSSEERSFRSPSE